MKQAVVMLAAAGISCVSVAVALRPVRLVPLGRSAAVAPDAGRADARRMSVSALLPLQADGRALVIDVRLETSFAAGHIGGAINVPVDEVETRGPELIRLASGRPIVTYCSCVHEHTSAVAAQELVAAGARDVSALLGGYPAWVAQGGRVEK